MRYRACGWNVKNMCNKITGRKKKIERGRTDIWRDNNWHFPKTGKGHQVRNAKCSKTHSVTEGHGLTQGYVLPRGSHMPYESMQMYKSPLTQWGTTLKGCLAFEPPRGSAQVQCHCLEVQHLAPPTCAALIPLQELCLSTPPTKLLPHISDSRGLHRGHICII